jgi:hypothetical protein
MPTELKFGIPDIELGCPQGRALNPSSFAGHGLVILFFPTDAAQAAEEIASYRSHCAEFVDQDAWVLAIGGECAPMGEGPGRFLAVEDPKGHAWDAFRRLADSPGSFARSHGATFFFTRGGNLHRSWPGPGHADEILLELRNPSA